MAEGARRKWNAVDGPREGGRIKENKMSYRLYDVIAERVGDKSFETLAEAEAERKRAASHGAKFEIIDGERVIVRAAESAYERGRSYDDLPA